MTYITDKATDPHSSGQLAAIHGLGCALTLEALVCTNDSEYRAAGTRTLDFLIRQV